MDLDLDGAIDSIGTEIVSRPEEPGEAELEATPAAPAEPAEPAPVTEAPETPETPATPATEPVVPSVPATKAPPTWRPEASAEWAKIPETVQQEILKREADMFSGLEQYKTQAQAASGVMSAIQPFMPILQQHNIQPEVMVKNLLSAQYTLATGSPQQKTAMLQRLAKDYGVEWGADAQMLDPQVSEHDQRLARLEQNWMQDVQSRTMQEVQTFASELGQDGKPLRPYFDDVANDIVGLIKSGQAADLSDAYEKAVWLNPGTRAKEVERLKAATQRQAQEAAEAARKAEAANVRTSAKAVTAGSPVGSMDDTLMETLKDIKSRVH